MQAGKTSSTLQAIVHAINCFVCLAYEDLTEKSIRYVLEEFALVGDPAEQVRNDQLLARAHSFMTVLSHVLRVLYVRESLWEVSPASCSKSLCLSAPGSTSRRRALLASVRLVLGEPSNRPCQRWTTWIYRLMRVVT